MKQGLPTALFFFLSLGFLNHCSQAPPPVDQAAVKSAITEVNQQFMAAYSAGDAAGVAALYTSDGMVLPPNSKPVQGRAAIEGFWKAGMAMGPSTVDLQTLEVHAGADNAVEVGKAIIKTPDGQLLDESSFMVWWKMEDGQWKLHRDIWNTDLPPPAPPAEEEVEEM